MVVLHAGLLWQMRDFIAQGYGDFTAFYTAGKMVGRGQASSLYDRRAQWEVQQEFASTVRIRQGPIPYLRPPFEALLFALFAYLPYPLAWCLWMALKICILFTVPWLLRPYMPGGPWISIPVSVLLCLSFFPVAFDLLQGQDVVLLLLLFTLAYRAMQRRADWTAGIFFALGLFKFHLVIPVMLVLLLRRKLRVVLGFLATASVLLLVSAALVGWTTLQAYPHYLWELNRAYGVGMVAPEIMPNVRGLIGVFAGAVTAPVYTNGLVAIAALAGIIFTAWIWHSGDDDDPLLSSAGFSLAVLVAILTSYYAYSYDMTLLLLPILLLGGTFLRSLDLHRWPARIFVACVALLLLSPFFWLLILRSSQFYWVGLTILLLLSVSLAWMMRVWRAQPKETGA